MKEIINLVTLTERIRTRMAELEVSQADLAKKANITPAAISQILRKERTPSSEVLVKLANALEVSVDFLVGRSKNVELVDLLQNSNIRDFYNDYSVLSQADKDRVRLMIDVLNSQK